MNVPTYDIPASPILLLGFAGNRSCTLHSLYSEQSILQLTIQIMKSLIQTLFLGTVAATVIYAPSMAYVVV